MRVLFNAITTQSHNGSWRDWHFFLFMALPFLMKQATHSQAFDSEDTAAREGFDPEVSDFLDGNCDMHFEVQHSQFTSFYDPPPRGVITFPTNIRETQYGTPEWVLYKGQTYYGVPFW